MMRTLGTLGVLGTLVLALLATLTIPGATAALGASPGNIDLGEQARGATTSTTVTVRNTDTTAMTVDIVIEDDTPGTFSASPVTFTMAADDEATFTLTSEVPVQTDPGRHSANLLVRQRAADSDDNTAQASTRIPIIYIVPGVDVAYAQSLANGTLFGRIANGYGADATTTINVKLSNNTTTYQDTDIASVTIRSRGSYQLYAALDLSNVPDGKHTLAISGTTTAPNAASWSGTFTLDVKDATGTVVGVDAITESTPTTTSKPAAGGGGGGGGGSTSTSSASSDETDPADTADIDESGRLKGAVHMVTAGPVAGLVRASPDGSLSPGTLWEATLERVEGGDTLVVELPDASQQGADNVARLASVTTGFAQAVDAARITVAYPTASEQGHPLTVEPRFIQLVDVTAWGGDAHAKPDVIESITLRLKVPTLALTDPKVTVDELTIIHETTEGWVREPTRLVSNGEGFAIFEAQAVSFSTFAIVDRAAASGSPPGQGHQLTTPSSPPSTPLLVLSDGPVSGQTSFDIDVDDTTRSHVDTAIIRIDGETFQRITWPEFPIMVDLGDVAPGEHAFEIVIVDGLGREAASEPVHRTVVAPPTDWKRSLRSFLAFETAASIAIFAVAVFSFTATAGALGVHEPFRLRAKGLLRRGKLAVRRWPNHLLRRRSVRDASNIHQEDGADRKPGRR